MSRVGIGASGGAWPMDPGDRDPVLFHAAGHLGRPDRHQIRLLARRRRCLCGGEPEARGGGLGRGPFRAIGDAGEGRQRAHASSPGTSTCGPTRPCSRWRSSSPRSCRWARWAASMRSRCRRIPEVEAVNHVHHAGNSSGIVDGAAAVLIGNQEAGEKARAEAARAHQGVRQYRLGAGDHADRADRRDARRCCKKARHDARRHRPVRGQRGVRLGGAALSAGLRPRSRQGQRQRRRHRHGSSARRDRRDDPRHRASTNWSGATSRPRWSRSASAPAWAPRRSSSGCERCPRSTSPRRRSHQGASIPQPFAAGHRGREKRRSAMRGLTQFGVNLTRLKPGAARRCATGTSRRTSSSTCSKASSTLIEDGGETMLRPGDCRGFKAGVANGHHLVNKSQRDALYLEIGTRAERERAHYPDIDLVMERGRARRALLAQVRRALSEGVREHAMTTQFQARHRRRRHRARHLGHARAAR